MKKLTIAALATALGFGTMTMIALADDGPHRGDRGERMSALLDEIDADGDGNITQAEVEATKAARFAEADANGDGGVTLEEMQVNMEARRAERQASRLEAAFSRLDEDGNGLITEDEMAARGEGRRGDWFERMDVDEDGVVTEAEREAAKAAHQDHRREGRRGGRD